MTMSEINTISVHELKKRLDTDANLCLIDVREDYEWQEIRIPGALHIPKNELPTRIEAQVPARAEPIYLHCRGGVRSLDAARSLLQLGYQEVYSIDGGISEWQGSGYPTEK
jgi:rhodanese-related sulfurtransferase